MAQGKEPALRYGSWKAERNRLRLSGAVSWMIAGGNVGIAGTEEDPLVIVDIDDETIAGQLKPTLITRSRSRRGRHGSYFTEDDIPNITTKDSGEVRSKWEYVVAPGSYVPTDPDEVPEDQRQWAGHYTVEDARSPAWITHDELPEVFLEQEREAARQAALAEKRPKSTFDPKKAEGRHSAVFDITAADVVLREGGKTQPTKRWSSIFHDSKTGANMSLSENGLLHCWRHLCSHNGLQALTVLSGYMTCEQAGTPHKNTKSGGSGVVGDDGAIFHAWRYAKEHGYIPNDDPVPVRGMAYIARKHRICEPVEDEPLPAAAYDAVLAVIEEEY